MLVTCEKLWYFGISQKMMDSLNCWKCRVFARFCDFFQLVTSVVTSEVSKYLASKLVASKSVNKPFLSE